MVTIHVKAKRYDTDHDRSELIIELIKKDSKITINQIAKKLFVSRITILREIGKLKEMGILHRIGPAKGGHWEVNKDLL